MSGNKERFVPLEKQSKKKQREHHAEQRTRVGFNTSTRTHKTIKHPSRAKAKEMARAELE